MQPGSSGAIAPNQLLGPISPDRDKYPHTAIYNPPSEAQAQQGIVGLNAFGLPLVYVGDQLKIQGEPANNEPTGRPGEFLPNFDFEYPYSTAATRAAAQQAGYQAITRALCVSPAFPGAAEQDPAQAAVDAARRRKQQEQPRLPFEPEPEPVGPAPAGNAIGPGANAANAPGNTQGQQNFNKEGPPPSAPTPDNFFAHHHGDP